MLYAALAKGCCETAKPVAGVGLVSSEMAFARLLKDALLVEVGELS
jgi:hypothetical protein